MPERKRLNLYFTDEEDNVLYEAIAEIATQEKRSMSQMAKMLIQDGIATRKTKPSSSSTKDNPGV